jgi:hypothetical protein
MSRQPNGPVWLPLVAAMVGLRGHGRGRSALISVAPPRELVALAIMACTSYSWLTDPGADENTDHCGSQARYAPRAGHGCRLKGNRLPSWRVQASPAA